MGVVAAAAVAASCSGLGRRGQQGGLQRLRQSILTRCLKTQGSWSLLLSRRGRRGLQQQQQQQYSMGWRGRWQGHMHQARGEAMKWGLLGRRQRDMLQEGQASGTGTEILAHVCVAGEWRRAHARGI